jgi:hypothetical protein
MATGYYILYALAMVIVIVLITYGFLALVKKIPEEKRTAFSDALYFISEFAFVTVLPGIGIAVTNNNCDAHPFENESVPTAYVLWIIFALAYVISRGFKEKLSPAALTLVSVCLTAGWIFCLVICVHFILMAPIIIFPGFNLLWLSPYFCLFFLLKEIRSINSLFISRLPEKEPDLKGKAYYIDLLQRNNTVTSGFFTAPFFLILQSVLYLLGQKPDSLISQFTESCGFLLSYEHSCGCGGDHYLCSIAANGNKKLVKPTRMGLRQNQKILVNRQLLIANAFENWLEEHAPRFHKMVRRTYDSMKIPVNKWSKQKRYANILYILMKPLEWFFLLWLYLFDKKPETRIARQYLPHMELNEFLKTNNNTK